MDRMYDDKRGGSGANTPSTNVRGDTVQNTQGIHTMTEEEFFLDKLGKACSASLFEINEKDPKRFRTNSRIKENDQPVAIWFEYEDYFGYTAHVIDRMTPSILYKLRKQFLDRFTPWNAFGVDNKYATGGFNPLAEQYDVAINDTPRIRGGTLEALMGEFNKFFQARGIAEAEQDGGDPNRYLVDMDAIRAESLKLYPEYLKSAGRQVG